jgi:hypothetical protein
MQEELTMLDYLLKVAPLINQFTQADLGVVVCDTEKWLNYIPARTLNLGIKPGEPVKEGSAAYRAMREKRRVVMEIDGSLYGVPYIAVGVPITDNGGKIIGAIACSENNERHEKILQISKKLDAHFQELIKTTQEISGEAQELSATSQELKAVSEDATIKVESTSSIIDAVKNIAKRTNLIGLNASIEAARVGEYGKGFTVVAGEVRSLSQMTNQSTVEIGTIINSIKSTIKSINAATQTVSEVSIDQAGKISGIYKIIDECGELTENLLKVADSLLGDNLAD